MCPTEASSRRCGWAPDYQIENVWLASYRPFGNTFNVMAPPFAESECVNDVGSDQESTAQRHKPGVLAFYPSAESHALRPRWSDSS